MEIEEIDTNNHKYNLRSKGNIEDVDPENTIGTKKNLKKSKNKFKIDDTKPKRTQVINSPVENSSPPSKKTTVINSENGPKVSKKKDKDYKITLTEKNTSGLATFALINTIVDAANKKVHKSKKHNSESGSDISSDDESYEGFEDLHPDIEYTDEEHKYMKSLPQKSREEMINRENALLLSTKNEVPLRFRLLNTELPIKTLSHVIGRLDHFYTLDTTENEYGKLLPWVNTLDKIPFGKFSPVIVTNKDHPNKIKSHLANTRKILDEAVYGHDTAKTQILSIIAREISNPSSMGNAIAIQGPMGNGKTTLVKEGICKAMKRPFALITLGGMSDASFLQGHEYTYEGARAGRIVEILCETGSMNPVFYFDELDKVSETAKGEEIINLLCHLTDLSQNNEFHDKYFSGVDFDLSRALFIFSYNDPSKINPILLDRMYKIKTDGFNSKSKLTISKNYLIPKLLKEFNFNQDDITFNDDALLSIVNNYCDEEKGVRNLKRNIETIISKLNIMRYLTPDKVKDTKPVLVEEPKTEVVEEPKTEAVEEPKTEAVGEPKTEAVEEPKTEVVEEPKSEVVEQPKTEVVEEPKTEVVEEPKTELVEEPKTEVVEEPKTEVVEETVVNCELEVEEKQRSESIIKETLETNIEIAIEELDTNISVKDVVDFTINNFKIPYNLTIEDLSLFLKNDPINPSIQHLYL